MSSQKKTSENVLIYCKFWKVLLYFPFCNQELVARFLLALLDLRHSSFLRKYQKRNYWQFWEKNDGLCEIIRFRRAVWGSSGCWEEHTFAPDRCSSHPLPPHPPLPPWPRLLQASAERFRYTWQNLPSWVFYKTPSFTLPVFSFFYGFPSNQVPHTSCARKCVSAGNLEVGLLHTHIHITVLHM